MNFAQQYTELMKEHKELTDKNQMAQAEVRLTAEALLHVEAAQSFVVEEVKQKHLDAAAEADGLDLLLEDHTPPSSSPFDESSEFTTDTYRGFVIHTEAQGSPIQAWMSTPCDTTGHRLDPNRDRGWWYDPKLAMDSAKSQIDRWVQNREEREAKSAPESPLKRSPAAELLESIQTPGSPADRAVGDEFSVEENFEFLKECLALELDRDHTVAENLEELRECLRSVTDAVESYRPRSSIDVTIFEESSAWGSGDLPF